MAIRLKVAKAPKEIDDALWVRHEVFVVEDGKFGGTPTSNGRMMDQFDATPDVYNIVAYDGSEPIATIRLTRESEIGLPADEYFDFSEFRENVRRESAVNNTPQDDSDGENKLNGGSPPKPGGAPVFGSAGMLAVRQPWRNRRDVIRAMYRVAAGVCQSTDVTHIVAVVNHRTAKMYRRLGFTPIAEEIWNSEIGDHIVPLTATSEAFCNWAYGDLPDSPLSMFRSGFERVFVRAGESIFGEGDDGQDAYIVGSGNVQITVKGDDGSDITLAHQSRGDLFGEFALIDSMPRSATATATSDSELITLDREVFHREIVNHPDRVLQLLGIFTNRIRRMDEVMSTLVSASQSKRLGFALGLQRILTINDPDEMDEHAFIAKRAADLDYENVNLELTTREFYDRASRKGELTYSKGQIRFVR